MAFNLGGLLSGAVSGAGFGSAFGPIGTAAGGLLGGLGGYFIKDKKRVQETQIQKQQRELVDQLLGSLKGNGPYSNLFNASPEDFQRSVAEPAMSRFRNHTAPQIQQSYIANGQQRGTGLEDTLARAGVDMDSILNQSYLQYQQGAQNRQANALSSILGANKGAEVQPSFASQYLNGQGIGNDIDNIIRSFTNNKTNPYQANGSINELTSPPRKGFENDQSFYNPYARGI